MAVAIACPACGKRYKIPDDRCGKKVRCQCGETFVATAEKSGSTSPLKPIGVQPKGAPAAELPPLASSPAAWDVDPFESTSAPASAPPQMAAAPTFSPPFKIVNDKYFRAAVMMLVMAMIGFAAPDLAKNLRGFRNAKASDFPIGASIFIALGA